jgi:hypothetical protein
MSEILGSPARAGGAIGRPARARRRRAGAQAVVLSRVHCTGPPAAAGRAGPAAGGGTWAELLPGLDMVNHGPGSDYPLARGPDGAVRLAAARTYRAGEEVRGWRGGGEGAYFEVGRKGA